MDAIQHGLTIALTGLILGLAVKAARRPAATDELGATVLRYPRFLIGFFWFGAIFFLVLALGTILIVALEDDASPWLLLSLLMYVPFGFLCIREKRVRIALDDTGLVAQTAFRGEVRMTWKTLKRVTFTRANRWYVLEDQHGQKVRISHLLTGSPALLGFLERHVDPAIWEPAAQQGEAARGTLF